MRTYVSGPGRQLVGFFDLKDAYLQVAVHWALCLVSSMTPQIFTRARVPVLAVFTSPRFLPSSCLRRLTHHYVSRAESLPSNKLSPLSVLQVELSSQLGQAFPNPDSIEDLFGDEVSLLR